MYAFYRNDKTVRIASALSGPDFLNGLIIKVSGKREARAIAAQHNARCWNF